MSAQPKTPLIFIRLPRNVVEKLPTLAAEELQLVLGGKERITTGTLRLGSQRFDVRFSSERSSAPPLLFQGLIPQPMGSDKWTDWEERGKLVGKLTVTSKNKPVPGSTTMHTPAMHPAAAFPTHSSDSSAIGQSLAARSADASAKALSPQMTAQVPVPAPTHTRMPSITRTAPQKKPGILRQNREMLKDQVLHILACGPEEETQILDRIKGPPNAVLDALGSLAQKTGSRWALQPESYKQVNIENWPKYDSQTKEKVAKNALAAFDTLGLPAEDPDRRRIAQVLQRINGGTRSSSGPPAADTVTSLSASVKLKSPTVPSISLPKDSPAPKKKPVRSIIAPTSVKKPRPELAKMPQRAGPPPGLAPENTSDNNRASTASNTNNANSGISPTHSTKAKEPSRHMLSASSVEAGATYKTLNAKPGNGEQRQPTQISEEGNAYTNQGRPRATSRSHFMSAPSTATNPTNPVNAASPAAAKADQRYLPVGRKNGRRIREEPDNYAASDAEAEYHRHVRPDSKSPITAGSQDSTHSRSQSHNPRGIQDPSSGADVEMRDAEDSHKRRHVPVRSRPIQMQSLVFSSPAKSPRVPPADTGAAVSRVQERLVQGMLSEKRQPGLSTSAKGHAQSSNSAVANTTDTPFKRPRGPSLSPVAHLPRSPSASPVPKVERAETIEDLEQLQRRIQTAYAEYSRLRIKIDSCCSEFSSLSDELSAAEHSFRRAWKEALNEHKTSEADREEGEEIPGDAPQDSELSLSIDLARDKCTSNGERLYWTAEPDASGDMWVTDSPEAILGQIVGRDGHPCRSRKLLPEEIRLLQATQAVVDRYAELDGDDVRRCIRRYLRLHAHLESMEREMRSAYSYITQDIMAQYDDLRAELGDLQVDKAISAADAGSESKTLSIDTCKDDQMASPDLVPTITF
ncbi:hypothetical protein IWW45_006247 [Coemansia sp. RSA 485]|nr:hypothetical protein IWW45_006247 [Coemansia sp. RSA 485]